jgi:outer membrane protein, multidrug efflux system
MRSFLCSGRFLLALTKEGKRAPFFSLLRNGTGPGEGTGSRSFSSDIKRLANIGLQPLRNCFFLSSHPFTTPLNDRFETSLVPKSLFALFVSATLLLQSCNVGPEYKKPAVDVPTVFRTPAGLSPAEISTSSAGDIAWSTYFQDPQLQSLIQTALKNNYDLRIAASRVLQAQATLGIARADQYPSVFAGATFGSTRTSQILRLPAAEFTGGQVTASAAWNLDFWGKYRNATEAARANLLATEWSRREVIVTLVSNIASAYFTLRAFDLQLDIARDALGARRESLRLTTALADHGSTSLLDVRQAEQLVYTAAEEIPDFERLIQQQENLISILVGDNPGGFARGLALTAQPHAPVIPAGLPSSLLERRPDIHSAEQQLISANAEIGVARAAYFPQISLTAAPGLQSSSLANLFTGPAGLWTFAASLSQPIFTAGRIRSNVAFTEAQREQFILAYQQSIQGAFRDVSDALIGYQKNQEFRAAQEKLTESAKDASRLSGLRYNGGAASYLEVLTNETNYFAARLNLAQAQLNELLSMVQLYQSLGGGWQASLSISPSPVQISTSQPPAH